MSDDFGTRFRAEVLRRMERALAESLHLDDMLVPGKLTRVRLVVQTAAGAVELQCQVAVPTECAT